MKTMKMIDLLVKIANREEVPRTILYKGETYTKYQNFNGTYYYKSISRKSILLLEQIRNSSDLLYEVGIIEEENKITINNEVAKCIKAIGQDLINRADDISNDLKDVSSITIYSKIVGGDIMNYDVTKNYCVKEFIDYNKIYKERRKERKEEK